jgi:hypothetical protein
MLHSSQRNGITESSITRTEGVRPIYFAVPRDYVLPKRGANLLVMDLPSACTLTAAELRERRHAIMDTFGNVQVTASELPDGYAFTFPPSTEALQRVAQLVDLER